jgi:glycine cleavage system H protein
MKRALFPDDRRYTPDHMWVSADGRVGITPLLLPRETAIERIHLPEVGDEVRAAEAFGCIELSKGIVDLHSPCTSTVVETNLDVVRDTEPLIVDPYRLGWLVRVSQPPSGLWCASEYQRIERKAHVRLRR